MAVHRRGYHQYDGPQTPERWRFWILARYAFKRVFRLRLLVVFYVLCFVPTLVASSAVYLSHHLDLLASLTGERFPDAELLPDLGRDRDLALRGQPGVRQRHGSTLPR